MPCGISPAPRKRPVLRLPGVSPPGHPGGTSVSWRLSFLTPPQTALPQSACGALPGYLPAPSAPPRRPHPQSSKRLLAHLPLRFLGRLHWQPGLQPCSPVSQSPPVTALTATPPTTAVLDLRRTAELPHEGIEAGWPRAIGGSRDPNFHALVTPGTARVGTQKLTRQSSRASRTALASASLPPCPAAASVPAPSPSCLSTHAVPSAGLPPSSPLAGPSLVCGGTELSHHLPWKPSPTRTPRPG